LSSILLLFQCIHRSWVAKQTGKKITWKGTRREGLREQRAEARADRLVHRGDWLCLDDVINHTHVYINCLSTMGFFATCRKLVLLRTKRSLCTKCYIQKCPFSSDSGSNRLKVSAVIDGIHCTWVWLFTAPDRTGPVPGRKWLIISLRRLLRVELRHNSEPTVLGLQLNMQETLNTSVINSSRASTRVHFCTQLRIISSYYAF